MPLFFYRNNNNNQQQEVLMANAFFYSSIAQYLNAHSQIQLKPYDNFQRKEAILLIVQSALQFNELPCKID